MGWSAHELPNKDWKLWTGGGTKGVYVQPSTGSGTVYPQIEIPSEILRMLVADDLRRQFISDIEDASDDEILERGFHA